MELSLTILWVLVAFIAIPITLWALAIAYVTVRGLKEDKQKHKSEGRRPKPWSDSDIEVMIRMANDGCTFGEISEALDRTAAAVYQKYRKVINK